RIVFTSSYGAMNSLIPVVSTVTCVSLTSIATPMRRSNFTVVAMSFRRGTLVSATGESASNVAARIGSAAFFAPEIRTSPSRRVPPTMTSLSKRDLARGRAALAAARAPLFWREGLQRERMNLAADAGTQCRVDELMALEAALARERRADHGGLVVALT